MYSKPQVNRKLPPESEMNRTDALDAFRAILNTATPEHPKWDDPFEAYPASNDEIEYDYTRTVHARCGPRSPPMVAKYATRMTHINDLSREDHLALLTHEITHIEVCKGVNGHKSGHPPAFWRRMAFLATEIRDAIEAGVLRPVFGEIDTSAYEATVIENPKPVTVDRRSLSVEECSELLDELINGH